MQRPGADTEDMNLSDFLCDFCRREWDGQFPMVEGHKGSLICGDCLTIAYTETVLHNLNSAPKGTTCTMCLEERGGGGDNMWLGPHEGDETAPRAAACERCIKQGAGRLHKDEDWDWKKPAG